MAALFIAAGLAHLFNPALYRPIMPPWIPAHDTLILFTGVAEILGGAGLVLRPTRRAAGIGLIALLVAVFPANIEMLRGYRAQEAPGPTEALLWLRLPLQGLLIWWTWRVALRRESNAASHA